MSKTFLYLLSGGGVQIPGSTQDESYDKRTCIRRINMKVYNIVSLNQVKIFIVVLGFMDFYLIKNYLI